MKFKVLKKFEENGTECWIFKEDNLHGQIFPIVLEVRNGNKYRGGLNHAIFLTHKSACLLTKDEETEMRSIAIQKIDGWKEIEEKEIHVVQAGLPGKYVNNDGNQRTLEEWDIAPEILAYDGNRHVLHMDDKCLEIDIKDICGVIRECRKMLEQASLKSGLIRSPAEEIADCKDDGFGPIEQALSSLINELWNCYFLLHAVLSKKGLIK